MHTRRYVVLVELKIVTHVTVLKLCIGNARVKSRVLKNVKICEEHPFRESRLSGEVIN